MLHSYYILALTVLKAVFVVDHSLSVKYVNMPRASRGESGKASVVSDPDRKGGRSGEKRKNGREKS